MLQLSLQNFSSLFRDAFHCIIFITIPFIHILHLLPHPSASVASFSSFVSVSLTSSTSCFTGQSLKTWLELFQQQRLPRETSMSRIVTPYLCFCSLQQSYRYSCIIWFAKNHSVGLPVEHKQREVFHDSNFPILWSLDRKENCRVCQWKGKGFSSLFFHRQKWCQE